MSVSTRTIGAAEAQERLPESQPERSIALFQHGTLTVKWLFSCKSVLIAVISRSLEAIR